MLALGNEGLYPIGKDGLTKWFSKDKLNVILQQDRTIDYLLYSYNWLICQIIKNNKTSLLEKTRSYLKHLMCYLVNTIMLRIVFMFDTIIHNIKYQPWSM